MSYSYALSREIYGLTPWCVDQHSFPSLMAIFNGFQKGISLEIPEIKYNTPEIFDLKSETRVINRPYGDGWTPGQLDSQDDFDGVGIININGPITVNGGASSFGMDYLSSLMLKMASDHRIKSFIVVGNSGGGATAAVELMTNAIDSIKKTKPVYGLVPRAGMSASAMYAIHASCTMLFAESDLSIVGSAGTMMQFEGRKANSEDPDGVKHIRLYATKSTQKNKGFEDALNNNDYSILISELLDPINEDFLSKILGYRPMLKGTGFDTGKTVFTRDAVGTYIDGIKNFTDVVNMSIADYKQNFQVSNKNNNPKNQIKSKSVMTVEELKSQFPATYNSIFGEGVKSGIEQEKDRVGSWLAHSNADPEAVAAGIASGAPISATAREQLLVKANSKSNLTKLEGESAAAIQTAESTTAGTQSETEADAFYKEVASQIN